ncbi:MAG TPA: hypothetical protein VFY06_00085 [Verrucomicrobiae bacterium]|nr:hypothetical protein [Verrucomicrobiae bacterium]
MKKFKALLLVTAGIAGVTALWLVVSLSLSALANRHRLQTFDDSDLIPTRVEVPVESNAFWTLLQATNALHWPRSQERQLDDLSVNTNWDDSLAAEVLDKNRASLDLFDQAMQKPFLQVPEPKKFEDDVSYLRGWKNLIHVAAIRANTSFHAKKEQEAFNEALEIIRFGQRAEDSGGTIIHYLVGAGIKDIGLNQIQQMTAQTTLGDTDLVGIIRELDDFKSNRTGLTNAVKVEYAVVCKFLDDLAAGKIPSATNFALEEMVVSFGMHPVFNETETKRMFAQTDRIMLAGLSKPYGEIDWSGLPVLGSGRPSQPLWRRLIKGNAIGESFYALMMPSVRIIASRKSKEDVHVTATQLLLALKIYKMRHGKLPGSLADLVPEELPQIPMDDFDGKPFRYVPEQKLIYSVGPDLKDDGGTGFHKSSKDYDIPFKIEF